MARHIYSIAVSALLILSLAVPLVIFLVTPDKDLSITEKRKLSVFPQLSEGLSSISEFPSKYNDYFDDHFGFRDEFIDLYDSIMLTTFNTSPSPYVIKGKNNWYFYVAGNVGKDFYGLSTLGNRNLERYSQRLIDRRIWLGSLGVHYLFVPVPNKINVYPEYLPTRIQGLSGKTLYQQLLSYRKKGIGEEGVLNAHEVLSKAKTNHQVYHRTDTHWNDDGALDVFNQIIKKINYWYPQVSQIYGNETTRTKQVFTGDLKKLLHNIKVVKEVKTSVSLNTSCQKRKNTPISQELSSLISNRKPGRLLPVKNGCGNEDLTILVIHDSFGEYLQKYFNVRFKTVIFSRKYTLHELMKLITVLRPDIVIEERVARDIFPLLAQDAEMEIKAVKHQLSLVGKSIINIQSSPQTVLNTRVINAKVQYGDKGVEIIVQTPDPQIIFPFRPENDGHRYNAMIGITAPVDTQLQIFYTRKGDALFSAERVITRKIKKGYNSLYIHLPWPDLYGQLRLDPGNVTGKYILHDFIVKERPELVAIKNKKGFQH